jgi:DNA-binding MarR family transcriptional regulator
MSRPKRGPAKREAAKSEAALPASAPKSPAADEAWDLMRELVLDNERRREVSDALGMSFGRLKALRRIDTAPRTMGELATILGTDPPYMTIVVDDLERQGLVERKPHPTDRRAKLVETTDLGKAAARQARDIMNRPPAELAALPEAELEALLHGLRAIRPDPTSPVIGLPENRIPPPQR